MAGSSTNGLMLTLGESSDATSKLLVVSLECRNNRAKSPLEDICYPLASRQRERRVFDIGNFDPHQQHSGDDYSADSKDEITSKLSTNAT